MYAYIKGTLVEASVSHAVIDTNGVGYHLSISVSDFSKLPKLGEQVLLHTTFVVREQSQTLYGFLTKESQALFEQLIAISGIGPKMGLAIIGHLSLTQLQEAIASHDCTTFSQVPGIGRKTAERLLVELASRLKIRALPKASAEVNDALQALIGLGYTQASAQKALKKAAEELPGTPDVSTLITAALKYR